MRPKKHAPFTIAVTTPAFTCALAALESANEISKFPVKEKAPYKIAIK